MPLNLAQLLAQIKQNNPKADTTLVELAYEYAAQAHAGQTRRSGEPYIQHPLRTALTLAQIRAENDVVIAGLLHDVPEDTGRPLAEIDAELKGVTDRILTMINGLTA